MEEIIPATGALCFFIFLYLVTDYFLKKDKEGNKNTSDNGIVDFDSFINLKTKYAKIFSIIVIIIIVLKIIFILWSNLPR